ncbi:carotenoid biosynthesis protein [Evansella sp. AB-rgal1]|uniref:carotenoid biosynthesis protein n=1 Tax=Evansella sp. AB-rgal1 TaxID=3242696 RepID=UPI00359EAFB1
MLFSTFDSLLFRFFIIWYICGVFLLTFDLLPPWLEWANVVFLLVAGILAMVYFVRSFHLTRGLFLIFFVFFLSMIMESIGVRTGLFFGDYTYESDFGPKLLGVPITIGFAWVMVIATSHTLASSITNKVTRMKGFVYALYASFIATALDFIIDPVAFQVKQYWIWNEPGLYYGIPASNFYGWFILSFVIHYSFYLFMYKNGKWISERTDWDFRMKILYVLMTCMFLIIAIVNRLFLASFLSVLFLLTIYLTYYIADVRRTDFNDKSEKKHII